MRWIADPGGAIVATMTASPFGLNATAA
jgi:hypothetical protein